MEICVQSQRNESQNYSEIPLHITKMVKMNKSRMQNHGNSHYSWQEGKSTVWKILQHYLVRLKECTL